MARARQAGQQFGGMIKYGYPFNDDEFPRNQLLSDNLVYTVSHGRWATRAEKSVWLYVADKIEYTGLADWVWVSSQKEFEYVAAGNIQSNIPTQRVNANTATNVRPFVQGMGGSGSAGEGEISIAYGGSWATGMGMNLTSKGEYTSYIRPVVNWKWKSIVMLVKIRGVYAQEYEQVQGAGGLIWTPKNPSTYGINTVCVGEDVAAFNPNLVNEVDLWDFYDNHTRPTNSNLIGYSIGYRIYIQKTASSVGGQLRSEFLFGDEYRLKGSISNSHGTLNMADYYSILNPATPTLLGTGPYTMMDGPNDMGRISNGVWFGPKTIEGIPICKKVMCEIAPNYGDLKPILGEVPVIDKDVLESGLLNKKDIVKIALQCGIPVLTKYVDVLRMTQDGTDLADLPEDEVYIPVIANGRVDTERYKQGKTAIEEDPYYIASSEGEGAMDTTPEVDREGMDTNEYTDDVPLNEPPFTPIGKFSRYYALSCNDLDDLLDFLYTGDPQELSTILDGLKLNGENPMNFMLGLRMMPFNITSYITSSPEEIGFGNDVHTGVIAEKIGSDSFVLDLGECVFPKYFGNFLDYEPYTIAKLYIPFCNEIEIPASTFAGHRLKIKMIVDITTGACVGVVFLNDQAILYTNGVMGVEIPITGENATQYAKTAIDTVIQGVTTATQIGIAAGMLGTSTAATGSSLTAAGEYGSVLTLGNQINSESTNKIKKTSPAGVMGGIADMARLTYDFLNQPTALQINGQGTPFTNMYKPTNCYFIIESPIPMNLDGYADTYGYACMKKGNLSQFSGFIQIANPNVQPPTATSAETRELNDLLSSGVWI